MLGDVAKDTGQSPHAESRVAWHCDMVLAALGGGEAKMAPGLTGQPIAQDAKGLREIVPGDVPREPQAVMTSSRTKWSRITRGAWPSMK